MTSKIKVNILADGGDNSIITSDGAGSFTASSSLASSVQSVGGIQNTPAFYGELASDQIVTNAVQTKLTGMTQNEIDTDTAFDGTTFTVPSGKAGKYYIYTQLFGNFDDVGEDGKAVQLNIFKNGSSIKEAKYETLTNNDLKFLSLNTSMLINLSESDTIEAYIVLIDVNSGTGMKANDGQTFLGGYKLIGA